MGIVWAAPYIQLEVVSLRSLDMREVTNLTIIVTTLAFKGIRLMFVTETTFTEVIGGD